MNSLLALPQKDPVLATMILTGLVLAILVARWPLRVSSIIDAITAFIGRSASWLILAIVLVSAGNAIIRKALDISSNAWLELQWILFGAVFLLASAYTLQRNEHVRIDVVFGALSRRVQLWINLFGHVFMLMPFALLMIYVAVPFFLRSVVPVGTTKIEESSDAGGLVVWPSKALLLAGFILLALQGVSEIIKVIAIMRGNIPDPHDEAAREIYSEHKNSAPEQKS